MVENKKEVIKLIRSSSLLPEEEYMVRFYLQLPIPRKLDDKFRGYGHRIWRILSIAGFERVESILKAGGYYN